MFPWNMFPFGKDMKGSFQGMKPQDVEKYVQETMSKVFSQGMNGAGFSPEFATNSDSNQNSNSLKRDTHSAHIFETHDFVFAMIPIKDEDCLQNIKVCHTSNQLIIENCPIESERQVYTLPATVKKKGGVATYKDGVLEVKIPKSTDFQYSEIDVKEIY
ncbi:Hsp20/alpha crystallin family protein [Robertmurraya sp. P23]|uniref:Hsp20/alpha crystallin family protein n=1 Tax=Robertmurraya sp. P23 TaxID=3436931 RepID=UPI003D956722